MALLIQGVGLVGEGWRPQIDGLRGRFRLVSPDNRGIGRSAAIDGPISIEDMAADAIGVMDSLGVDRFHVAGHSMGGVIAQEVALRIPARIASLAFLCSFARGPQGSRITPALLLTALRMRVGTLPMRRNAFLELVMPIEYLNQVDRGALAEELRPLFGHDLAEQPPVVMKQVRAMSRYDASARLKELGHIPTLVISASGDRIALPRYGRELAGLIPSARYVEIADAGHGVTIQRPREINDLLEAHWLAATTREASASPATVSEATRRTPSR